MLMHSLDCWGLVMLDVLDLKETYIYRYLCAKGESLAGRATTWLDGETACGFAIALLPFPRFCSTPAEVQLYDKTRLWLALHLLHCGLRCLCSALCALR